jgi:hypothetical protein
MEFRLMISRYVQIAALFWLFDGFAFVPYICQKPTNEKTKI